MDVAPHPHIGLQTVSWLLEGEVVHHDSLGLEGTAAPGVLNLMTAGRGIAHAEETPAANAGRLQGVQLWVALPEASRETAPAFESHRALPVVELEGGRATVILGELGGARSPARAFSPIVGVDVSLTPGGRLVLPLEPEFEHALVPLAGDCRLDDQPLAVDTLYYLGCGRRELALRSEREPARALLIGGAPFGETILMWWNFVARSDGGDRRRARGLGGRPPLRRGDRLRRPAHPGPAVRRAPGPALIVATASSRLTSVDALRGAVMVLMTLDHVRDFFHVGAMSFSPEDLPAPRRCCSSRAGSRTSAPRPSCSWPEWAAYLRLQRPGATKAQLSRFLWTRGLWLVFLELTLMRLAMTFELSLPALLLILWALGMSMLALAALVHLPTRALAVASGAVIVLHNLLDPLQGSAFGAFAGLWNVLHQPGLVMVAGVPLAVVGYPLVPWVAVMAAGYCSGSLFLRAPARASARPAPERDRA